MIHDRAGTVLTLNDDAQFVCSTISWRPQFTLTSEHDQSAASWFPRDFRVSALFTQSSLHSILYSIQITDISWQLFIVVLVRISARCVFAFPVIFQVRYCSIVDGFKFCPIVFCKYYLLFALRVFDANNSFSSARYDYFSTRFSLFFFEQLLGDCTNSPLVRNAVHIFYKKKMY